MSIENGVVDVGRYRLIAELAHGGMGDVYLGVARGPAGFNKLMVIKQLRPALADDEQFLAMFLEEARLAARLSHPNVVQTVEVGNEGKRYFLAMEYLEGQSLQRMRQRIGKDRPFPLGPHIRILIETLQGLHYAHELVDIDGTALGVVHRDATPHNIFVTYDGQVKVVDFGIAKAMDSSLETRTGELKGKVAYMPPEQASAKRVDRRADIFAVGVMLWEAATGRRMWKGMNEIAIMHSLFAGEIPSPRSVDARVPEELDRICRIALSPTPEYRYATAAEMAAELEAYLVQIGDRTGTRDIARLVTDAFEADRKEMKDIIDAQLRALRTSDRAVVATADLTGLMSPSASVPRVSTAQLDASAAPSFTTGGTASSMKPAPSRAPRVVAALMAVSAVGLVAVLAGVAWQNRGKDTASAAIPSDSASATAPKAVVDLPPGAPRTKLALTSTPPDAKLFIDDAPLDGNPYNGAFPKDGLAHRVRAEAKDYIARTEVVVFDKDDVAVTLTLPKRSQVGGTFTGTKPAPKPSVDPATDASAKKKPHRDIDTSFGSGAP